MNDERPPLLPPSSPEDAPTPEGWEPMLSIRLATQRYFAIRMGNLLWVEYDPSGRLVLRFSTHTIRLGGRGLDLLYRQLLRLECKEIVVSEEDLEPVGAMVILSADIERKPGHDDDA